MHVLDSLRPFWLELSRFAYQPALLGPLLAFLVGGLARLVLRGPLAPAGIALALVCGWVALFGPTQAVAHIWSPRPPSEGLLLGTLGATVVLMALESSMRQQASFLLALVALAEAWWLSGAHSLSVVMADQVVRIGFLAVLIWAGMRAFLKAEAWMALVSALALALALLAANDGGAWPALGFVVAAVAAAQLPGKPAAGTMAPAGLALGGVAGLAVLVTGRLPHGGIGAADVAGAAPFVTMWLPGPLRRLGPRFGPPVAGLLMVLATFLTRRLVSG